MQLSHLAAYWKAFCCYSKKKNETHQEMRIPEGDLTYIVLSVYLLLLVHRNSIYIPLNLTLISQNIYSTLSPGLEDKDTVFSRRTNCLELASRPTQVFWLH